jgi:hypothetical protein
MTELAFLIFAVVGLVATAKLWKPFLNDKADELEIIIKDKRVDQQEELYQLSQKVDEVKVKHGGQWITLESIENKMK